MFGTVFEGTYEDDDSEGFGTLTMPDGSVYAGEFHDDMQHGNGIFTGILFTNVLLNSQIEIVENQRLKTETKLLINT